MKKSFLFTILAWALTGCAERRADSAPAVLTDRIRFAEAVFPSDGKLLVGSFGSSSLDPLNTEGKGYVLEFTERVLAEEVPSPGIFSLLIDFFDLLENRDKGIGTLVLAYQTKVFRYTGVMPQLERCAICGEEKPAFKFSVEEGGVICRDCFQAMENLGPHALIYDIKFGILDILKYFTVNPLKKLENIALKEDAGKLLQEIIREYAAYYLDASDLKSEKLI